MYGACRAVGIGPPVVVCGKSLPVHARTISDYAVLEGRILELRGNPFDSLRWLLVCANGSKSASQKLFTRLRAGWWNVTYSELLGWLGTWDGRIHALWLATRKLDLADVRAWVIDRASEALRDGRDGPELWWSGIQQCLDLVNGDDEISALEWLAKTGETNADGINWGAVYRTLGDEPLCFPPESVAQMTMTQIKFFYCKRENAGNATPDPSNWTEKQMIEWTKKTQESSAKAVDNLSRGRMWSAQ